MESNKRNQYSSNLMASGNGSNLGNKQNFATQGAMGSQGGYKSSNLRNEVNNILDQERTPVPNNRAISMTADYSQKN